MPEVSRIKNYLCFFIVSIVCITVGFLAIGPTIESSPCPKGFYSRDETMLCSTCTFTLTDVCKACDTPFNCNECETGSYLEVGQCFSCAKTFTGC
jgi:hypothetical protein